MKVTYIIHQKGNNKSLSLGPLSLQESTVTLQGTVEEIKQITEYLEQKYDLA